jgi:hypothetical protein
VSKSKVPVKAKDRRAEEEPPGWRYVPTWEEAGGQVLEPNWYCRGANPRRQKYCRRRAGYLTDHLGHGRCARHGGSVPVKHGRYSTVRLESLRQIAEQMEADPDPLNILPELAQARALYVDFLNRYGEYAAALLAWHESWRAAARPVNGQLRAGMSFVVDELEALLDEPTDQQKQALSNARAYLAAVSAPVEGRPTQLMDLADADRLLANVTRIVERIERIRAANAISRPDLMRVMQEMGRAMNHHLAKLLPILGEEQRAALTEAAERIADEWLSIRV